MLRDAELAQYLASGESTEARNRRSITRQRDDATCHVITARAPGRQHDGKWLTVSGKSDRVDTRESRGNKPRTGSAYGKASLPTAKHIAYRESGRGVDGWSKPAPEGLEIG